MATVFEAPGWRNHVMDTKHPYRELEPLDAEVSAVDAALEALVREGVIPHTRYAQSKFMAFRAAVRENFDVPWTAITPRMQRLIYAVNTISQPQTVVAVGIFCGFTFISNVGAAVGPGACYRAERLIGIEIDSKEAARAQSNVSKVDPEGLAQVVAADGIPWLRDFGGAIDLLYLDANDGGKGKAIYLDLLQAGFHALHPGSVVLAHNSVNSAEALASYLAFVRDPVHFSNSVNIIMDTQGLEVSVL